MDFTYYEQYLPGITEDMPNEFEKLAQLISQDQFEWLEDGRVVFLMNDAVESFLVFQNAKMTGELDSDYEGWLTADLEKVEDDYLLILHQGEENVVTIRFSDLKLEVHLYNYGEIGHFWVAGQEDLRQLEYRLAILRDKVLYLGEDYATTEEIRLAELAFFPPIMTWLAVPPKYATPPEEPWKAKEEAIEIMLSFSEEAEDKSLKKKLLWYQSHPNERVGRYLAKQLTRWIHVEVLYLIARKLREAGAQYPNRSFGTETDIKYQEMWEQACGYAKELQAQGDHVTVLREEPFVTAPDDLTYKVYLFYTQKKLFKKQIQIRQLIEK